MRLVFLLCVLLCSTGAWAAVPPKLHVVTSFSILEDIAKQIGGDRVEVKSLVGRNMDMHNYEPKPADAVLLKHADLFIVNGLGFEGFLPRLVEAADFKGDIVEATRGIQTIKNADPEEQKEHGMIDPHAWQSLRNGIIYARNIATAFAAKDPEHKRYYNERLKGYILRIDEVSNWASTQILRIPFTKRNIVIAHNGFAYFESDYGIHVLPLESFATEGETYAKAMVTIINAIRAKSVRAIFLDKVERSAMGESLCAEAQVPCGQLYSDALTDKSGPAYTYLELFQTNVRAILAALK